MYCSSFMKYNNGKVTIWKANKGTDYISVVMEINTGVTR